MLCVPDNTKLFEHFETKCGSKLRGKDYHEEFVIVSVTPTGIGKWKTIQHEDDINVSVAIGCCYIKFQVTAFVYGYGASSKVLLPTFPLSVQHTAYKCRKTGLLTKCAACCYPQTRTVQICKCGDVPCMLGLCMLPHLDEGGFKKLYFLPDPQPGTNRPGHFLLFTNLKWQDNDEKYCPSLTVAGKGKHVEDL